MNNGNLHIIVAPTDLSYAEAITRFQVDMALLGMAFSPEYGESYYEIFGLGNYDNIVHFTHPGNVLALRLTTAIDIPLGKKQKWGVEFTIGVGYMNIVYDVYEGVYNGKYLRTEKMNYFGPTRLGINFSYRIDVDKKKNK